jgi:ribosome modulation factor
MAHYRLRDLRDKWAGNTDSVIYLAPPKPVEPKINRTKKAYDMGYAARTAGKAQHTCPHNAISGHRRYAAWRMGWAQADRELSSCIDVFRPEHPPGYVAGVWKNTTTPFGSAILAYSAAGKRKTSRQKVADWCRSFKSKSGWKASDGRRSTGGAMILS